MRAIYRIRNLVNDKFYIGSSIDVKTRWKGHKDSLRHRRHKNKYLQSSWNKHGEHSFVFEIVEECDELPDDKMIEREQWHLDNSGCLNPDTGFNLRVGAGGGRHSAESCRKISMSKRGFTFSAESRSKMRAAKLGTKVSAATRLRMSEAHKGRRMGPMSAEQKAKLSRINLDKNDAKRKLRGPIPDPPPSRWEVEQIDLSTGMALGCFKNISIAARETGADRVSILGCCKGTRKSSGGFGWKRKISPLLRLAV